MFFTPAESEDLGVETGQSLTLVFFDEVYWLLARRLAFLTLRDFVFGLGFLTEDIGAVECLDGCGFELLQSLGPGDEDAAGPAEESAQEGVRCKRRDDEHAANVVERPLARAGEPERPEGDGLEPIGRLEPDTPKLALHEVHGLADPVGYIVYGAAGEGTEEVSERVVDPEGVLAVRQHAFKDEEGVPGAVEGKVAAEDQKAIHDRLSFGEEVERPDLRVEDGVFTWSSYLEDRALKIAEEELAGSGDGDLPGLAEDADPVRIAPEALEEG
jgi:hypothetical protein